jgi:hypothetical protein
MDGADESHFIGEWGLLSFHAEDTSGSRVYPLGEDAVGRILYTASGRVSAHLAKKDRAKPATKNVLAFSDAEKSTAFGEALAYTGDFDVDVEAGTVTHHVFISTDPGQTGTDLTRDYEFGDSGKTLSLGLTYHNGSKMVLLWKRLDPYLHRSSAAPSTERQLG